MRRYSWMDLGKIGVLGLLGCVLLVSLWHNAMRIRVELLQPFYGDAGVYIVAGKAILNGLVPYRDFLEIKPPGFLLLTALALWVGHGVPGITFLRFALLITPSVLVVAATAWNTRRDAPFKRIFLLLIAAIFASQLLIHLQDKVGGYQAEAPGVMFGMFYVLLFLFPGKRFWVHTLLLAATLGAAVSMKEPFLVALAGCSFLLAKHPRDAATSFLLPLAIAGIAGLLFLLLMGYLGPYLTIYLPAIFGDRIVDGGPLSIRGLRMLILLDDLTRYHARVPVTGAAIIALFLFSPLLRDPQDEHRWPLLLATPVFLFTTLWAMFIVYEFQTLSQPAILEGIRTGYFTNPFPTLLKDAVFCAMVAVGSGAYLFIVQRRVFFLCCTTVLAAYCLIFAAGIGNFFQQHMLFAAPAFVAVFVLLLQACASAWEVWSTRIIVGGFATILVFTVFQHPSKNLPEMTKASQMYNQMFATFKQNSAALDAIIESCKFPFHTIHATDNTIYSRYSPLDLAWPEERSFIASPNLTLRRRFFERLDKAGAVLIGSNGVWSDEELKATLARDFTETPPPCAAHLPQPEGAKLLYRIQRKGDAARFSS